MKKLLLAWTAMLLATCANAKTLIVYYSFTNNVHTIATELKKQTNADLLRIEPAEEGIDYAANNYAIGSALIQAIREAPNEAASYPAIKPIEIDLSDYDTIIIGAPLWWSNMAAPMQTFLFQYGKHMENKNIGLFVSSASSGISGVEADARRLVPNGDFLAPSLWIRSSQTSNCQSLVSEWLEEIDYGNLTAIAPLAGANTDMQITMSRGQLYVKGSFDQISLYTLSGAEVARTTSATLDTAGLTPGIYIGKVKRGKRIVTQKLHIANQD